MKILFAGVGNVLRGDDSFGVAVAEELRRRSSFGNELEIFEAGIAGISLVQELMSGYEALIVADTVDRGAQPGTLFVIEPERRDPAKIEAKELHNSLVDAHYTDPSKVLLLAAALGVLPRKVFLVGCQPQSIEDAKEGLSERVAAATCIAADKVEEMIRELVAP